MCLKFSRLLSDLLLVSGILCCCVSIFSCKDDSDTVVVPMPEGESLSVSLTIDFSNEADGYAPHTRGADDGQNDAFEAMPIAVSSTRSSGVLPTSLYNLEIRQYDQNGKYLNGQSLGNTTIGSKITIPLTATKENEDCQLLIVARGDGNTIGELGGKSLSAVQTDIIATSTKIEAIDPSVEMKTMPYMLHLPHVKVVADAANPGKGIIQSSENGTEDVRLRLKRLVARVTLNWTLSDAMKTQGYELKEVKLCQVPKQYYLFPASENTEWGTTYPSTVSEFVDVYRLTDTELTSANGSKSVWIPANVRGTSSASTAPIHRTKENAPTAASYAEIVVDNTVKKERLYYRAYLGGNDPSDFNLNENTDYNWTLNIKSADYTGDPRIELLDQTPVQSDNLVPTANCLMLQPGGNLCFNPYQHTSGTNGWNDYLVNNPGTSPAIKTAIASVKVLWQAKDAGTSGDLVLGYIIDDTHHENLANITNPDDINQTRVHVKAPVTKGGNAVIAAYAADGKTVLWSWHIWVTDYVPTRINSYSEYATAQKSTRNGTVHKYRSVLWKEGGLYANMVMMDRELGARSGGYPGITIGDNYTLKDAVNTQGLLYQWGRKDPFFGSADGSVNEINVIFDGYGMAKGVTNLPRNSATLSNGTYLQYTIEHPLTFLYYWNSSTNSDWWDNIDGNELTEAGGAYRWNAGGVAAPGKKTIYDPCPNGWKVPMRGSKSAVNGNYFVGSIFDGLQSVTGTPTYNGTDIVLNNSNSYFTYAPFNFQGTFYWKNEYSVASVEDWGSKANPQGGRIFFLEDGLTLDEPQKWTIHNTFWFPSAAERHPEHNGQLKSPSLGHNWTADGDVYGSLFCIKPMRVQLGFFTRVYGWSVRCIQETIQK